MATARLGKTVVDLVDVGFQFGTSPLLEDVTWRIGPGERSAILGANGAGKSTLLRLIAGDLEPTEGRVRRGKTVQLAVLDQQFSALADIGGERVREVLSRTKASFNIDGKDLTPAQLLERLGFSSAHLSSFVRDLSGGQKRRLQLLLILLEEPNVLILDEPTNDVDTDMLAALEDLLDTWPGTLLVVSHDRYLVERATDQQYAILDGTLRHLPRGVDEYLELSAKKSGRPDPVESTEESKPDGLSGAERHAGEKELASVERRLERVAADIERVHKEMAAHDQTDYEGLQKLTSQISAMDVEVAELEERWLLLGEKLAD